MMSRWGRATAWSLLLCACSGGDAHPLRVGREPELPSGGTSATASHGSRAGTAGSSVVGGGGHAGAGTGRSASGDHALGVHVEDGAGTTIDVITLACAGDCADVEAVARGGNPPYTFAWDDGATSSKRHVCLDASRELMVMATDTAIDAGEFRRDAQSASARVTASVLDCSNASPPPIGDCDSVSESFVAGDQGQNPVGPWSYGYIFELGGAFTIYPTYYPVTPISLGAYAGKAFPEAAQWFDESQGVISGPTYAIPPIPDVLFNPGPEPRHPSEANFAGDQFTLAPQQLALDPGTQGQLSVVRWTASRPGTFVVTATFTGLCGDNGTPVSTTAGYLLHNGATLDSGYVNLMGAGNELSIMRAVAVQAGDTLDFALSDGGNAYLYDFTALAATVCEAAL